LDWLAFCVELGADEVHAPDHGRKRRDRQPAAVRPGRRRADYTLPCRRVKSVESGHSSWSRYTMTAATCVASEVHECSAILLKCVTGCLEFGSTKDIV
jgi:hypothetical protein